MKGQFFAGKILLFILLIFAFIVPLGFIVMALWNNILTPILHVPIITFWHALGLFLLSRILFGGFPGGRGMRGNWKQKMNNKWNNMTPEQREQFKQNWQNRCANWKRPAAPESNPAQ